MIQVNLTCAFICSKFVVNKMIRHLFGRKLLCVTKQPLNMFELRCKWGIG